MTDESAAGERPGACSAPRPTTNHAPASPTTSAGPRARGVLVGPVSRSGATTGPATIPARVAGRAPATDHPARARSRPRPASASSGDSVTPSLVSRFEDTLSQFVTLLHCHILSRRAPRPTHPLPRRPPGRRSGCRRDPPTPRAGARVLAAAPRRRASGRCGHRPKTSSPSARGCSVSRSRGWLLAATVLSVTRRVVPGCRRLRILDAATPAAIRHALDRALVLGVGASLGFASMHPAGAATLDVPVPRLPTPATTATVPATTSSPAPAAPAAMSSRAHARRLRRGRASRRQPLGHCHVPSTRRIDRLVVRTSRRPGGASSRRTPGVCVRTIRT